MDCQLEEAVLNLIKLQFVDCLGQQVSPGIDNQNVLSYNSMNEWTDLCCMLYLYLIVDISGILNMFPVMVIRWSVQDTGDIYYL